MFKQILAALFVLVAFDVSAQQNFQYSPQNPKAGDVISFTYTPAGDIANTQKAVEGAFYTLGSKGQNADNIILKQEGNKYTGSIKTDTSQNFIFFGFSADKKFDNNFNNGYWIQLHDRDKLKKGAYNSAAQFYLNYGSRVGIEPNLAKSIPLLENEFALYPETRKDMLAFYMYLLTTNKKAEAPALIQKEIESVLKIGLKEEADYTLLENLYNTSKLTEQGKLITTLKKEKFPNGKWAIAEKMQSMSKEEDLAKRELLLNEVSQKIAGDENWKYLQASLPTYQYQYLYSYITKKNWQGFTKAIERINFNDKNLLARLYNSAAWEMQKASDNLKLAEKFSATSLTLSKAEWLQPSVDKPGYLTKSEWDKSRHTTYAGYADTYAMVLYRMEQYKKGLIYARENLKLDKGMVTSSNNTYALLAEKTLPVRQYKKELEQFVKDGKSTAEIKDILKRLYNKEKKSDPGFDNYIATLEKASYLQMVAELRKSMLNDAAPSFTLYDLNKNKVDIADLKNKIVVVDFWATWCGPCIASFPTMQKMVNKYKDDSNVKFIFVDTWENGENKQKDASDFIATNKYTFHVLQDVDNKVVEQFKVKGIPTKFILDKNGVIRFKSVGWDGDEKLSKELSAMIAITQDLVSEKNN